MKDILSIAEFSREEAEEVISAALHIKQNQLLYQGRLQGKLIASLFFESSTRTRTSHELAAHNLGISVIGFAGTEGTSVKKGEPLADTLRMYEGYGAEALILRHHLDGAARFAADVLSIPVINAGDGSNAHPTQTLLDLMTIYENKKKLDGIRIAFVGDLRYGRTVHSLLQGLALFSHVQVWLIAPPNLQMPEHLVQYFEQKTGTRVTVTPHLAEVLPKVDIVYMTRIQRERFPEGLEGEYEYKKVSGIYELKKKNIETAPHLMIMHPLPRYKHQLEINFDVDTTKQAFYFEQARNGLFLRQALLLRLLQNPSRTAVQEQPEEQLWQDFPISDGTKQGEHLLYRLENGTLIDHIEQGKGLEVYRILHLHENDTPVVPALNIRSQRYGSKDVLAIHGATLTPQQLWKVTLVSEQARINIIQKQRVIKKGKVRLPRVLEGLVKCPNERCISAEQHHEYAPSKFKVQQQEPLQLHCYYCHWPVDRETIILA